MSSQVRQRSRRPRALLIFLLFLSALGAAFAAAVSVFVAKSTTWPVEKSFGYIAEESSSLRTLFIAVRGDQPPELSVSLSGLRGLPNGSSVLLSLNGSAQSRFEFVGASKLNDPLPLWQHQSFKVESFVAPAKAETWKRFGIDDDKGTYTLVRGVLQKDPLTGEEEMWRQRWIDALSTSINGGESRRMASDQIRDWLARHPRSLLLAAAFGALWSLAFGVMAFRLSSRHRAPRAEPDPMSGTDGTEGR